MKELYYMIDFSTAACLFEIRVNDQPPYCFGILKKNKKGDTIIFATFVGCFTWGAIYYKWVY